MTVRELRGLLLEFDDDMDVEVLTGDSAFSSGISQIAIGYLMTDGVMRGPEALGAGYTQAEVDAAPRVVLIYPED